MSFCSIPWYLLYKSFVKKCVVYLKLWIYVSELFISYTHMYILFFLNARLYCVTCVFASANPNICFPCFFLSLFHPLLCCPPLGPTGAFQMNGDMGKYTAVGYPPTPESPVFPLANGHLFGPEYPYLPDGQIVTGKWRDPPPPRNVSLCMPDTPIVWFTLILSLSFVLSGVVMISLTHVWGSVNETPISVQDGAMYHHSCQDEAKTGLSLSISQAGIYSSPSNVLPLPFIHSQDMLNYKFMTAVVSMFASFAFYHQCLAWRQNFNSFSISQTGIGTFWNDNRRETQKSDKVVIKEALCFTRKILMPLLNNPFPLSA